MSIPWFYTWSDEVFHKVMQDTIKGFDLRPIQSDASTLKERAALVVSSMKSTSEPYILFSISDVIVNSGFASEVSEIKGDIVFIDAPKSFSQTSLMLLRNTSDVLDFWNSLSTSDLTLEESILSFKGTSSKFSSKCLTTDTWDKRSDFSILVLLSNGYGKEFDFAEKVFRMAQHVDFQEYMQYVPEEVVPFIYKIQELLFLTHKEMKKSS
jgi:hypothetical protein